MAQPSYLESLQELSNVLAEREQNEALAEYGVRFSEEPLRNIGGIAWALSFEDDRPAQFVVTEDIVSSAVERAADSSRTLQVSRLIVDMTAETAHTVRYSTPDVSGFGSYGREETAHHALARFAKPFFPRISLGHENVRENIMSILDGTTGIFTSNPFRSPEVLLEDEVAISRVIGGLPFAAIRLMISQNQRVAEKTGAVRHEN